MNTVARLMAAGVVCFVAACGGNGGSGDVDAGKDTGPAVDTYVPDPGMDIDKDDGEPILDIRPELPLDVQDEVDSDDDPGGTDEICIPDCEGRDCGSDGCDGICGYCSYGYICNTLQICRPFCEPDCEGKDCGADGCGGFCGDCEENERCSESFTCVLKDCVPSCGGKECGPDGCGACCNDNCGCGEGQVCLAGQCTEDTSCHDVTATGRCEGYLRLWCEGGVMQKQQCDDVPGYVCGYSHLAKKYDCVLPEICVPQCTGKQCGPDGCQGSCGACDEGKVCSTTGVCGQPCNTVTECGECRSNNRFLAFCQEGILREVDCYDYQTSCKWVPQMCNFTGGYDCL
jgi:hypothetical protein